MIMKNNNSNNKCVNVQKKETHEYTIGDTRFIVRVVNKNENTQAVKNRLKSVIVNHSDTKN